MTASPQRWQRLWRQVGARDDGHPAYQELVSLYSQPHRHYHNLNHISECLNEFDSALYLAKQPLAVELAIWFHDAVYDTHATDNEEQSAELAKTRIGPMKEDANLLASAWALVLATKTHDPSYHPDAPLLVDIDLSILGKSQEQFWQYENQIRREYDWVPQGTFAAKRAEILERFLARERIYSTQLFFEKYEKQARANIQASIRQLRSPSHVQ